MRGFLAFLSTERGRTRAIELVTKAPSDWLCRVEPPRRSIDQNSKLWAMLSDVSCSMPDGRRHTPEDWKAIFMNACGWEVQFLEGLDGRPFPSGFRSSNLTKQQMSTLIDYIQAFGDERAVVWTDEARAA